MSIWVKTEFKKNLLFYRSALFFIFLLSISNYLNAQSNNNVKSSQRAIFIFNLSQQVQWPNFNDLDSFNIGVLGIDPTIYDLALLAKRRKISEKPVVIKRYNTISSVKDIQVLYVNKVYGFDINLLFNKISGNNTLLITEGYDFNTSMINMLWSKNTFRYEINNKRIEKENLILGPSLKQYAVNQESKWKSLYEVTQKSLEKVKDDNEEKESIIKLKDQKIQGIEDKVEGQNRLIKELATKTAIQQKKYEEKLKIEIDLENKLQNQVGLLKEQQKEILNQKDEIEIKQQEISISNQEISKQQKVLLELGEKIKNKELLLNSKTTELNTQKKINWLLIALVALFFTGAFIIYKGYVSQKKLRKNIEKINSEVKKQAAKLKTKNEELTLKNHRIFKQKKVLESQNYDLEQFAYIASHDLQEPLNTITGFIEILNEDYGDKFDNEAKDSFGYITQASHRMKRLILVLLEYSKLGRDRVYTQLNCNEIIEDLKKDLNSVISEKNAIFEVGELPKSIMGSDVELRLLFQNLITNAIKFIGPNTTPKVKIYCEEEKLANSLETKTNWRFSVQDNGIGIPADKKERVFEIFQRLHTKDQYKGTGIGLAHCKKIVESHGGEIWVESEEGKGATFFFTIPKN